MDPKGIEEFRQIEHERQLFGPRGRYVQPMSGNRKGGGVLKSDGDGVGQWSLREEVITQGARFCRAPLYMSGYDYS